MFLLDTTLRQHYHIVLCVKFFVRIFYISIVFPTSKNTMWHNLFISRTSHILILFPTSKVRRPKFYIFYILHVLHLTCFEKRKCIIHFFASIILKGKTENIFLILCVARISNKLFWCTISFKYYWHPVAQHYVP